MRRQPFGRDQRLGTGIRHGGYSAKAMLMRRFCRPLFSILPIVTGPISAVLRICVPPFFEVRQRLKRSLLDCSIINATLGSWFAVDGCGRYSTADSGVAI